MFALQARSPHSETLCATPNSLSPNRESRVRERSQFLFNAGLPVKRDPPPGQNNDQLTGRRWQTPLVSIFDPCEAVFYWL